MLTNSKAVLMQTSTPFSTYSRGRPFSHSDLGMGMGAGMATGWWHSDAGEGS